MIHTDARNSRHFHIFWHGINSFDWDAFDSYDDAAVCALQIALPGEIFSIKCFSTDCPACKPRLPAAADFQIST